MRVVDCGGLGLLRTQRFQVNGLFDLRHCQELRRPGRWPGTNLWRPLVNKSQRVHERVGKSAMQGPEIRACSQKKMLGKQLQTR